jgi:hypothetical protein
VCSTKGRAAESARLCVGRYCNRANCFVKLEKWEEASADAGAAAVASFLDVVVTEMYLCTVCSCQEILRWHGRGQGRPSTAMRATRKVSPPPVPWLRRVLLARHHLRTRLAHRVSHARARGRNRTAYAIRAQARVQLENYEDAVGDYNQATRLSPDSKEFAAVSRSRARIGSPCLRRCVHGASI